MSITRRQEQILELINQHNFITVNELAAITFTSASSIRRDLTYLQNNGIVKRSHGGVALPDPFNRVASYHDRVHKNIREKRIITQKAAALLKDGQSILLDSSSTAFYMLPHIVKLRGATIFTSNLSTALNAIELGIDTHCIGGHSVNGSVALSGTESYKALADIHADILFFSSQSLDSSGVISDATEEENYLRQLMLRAAKKSVFLCDSSKFHQRSLYQLTLLDCVNYGVFDTAYPEINTKCQLL